ncbi:hypothetical protein VNO78_28747 [Psophocarpus tetragonolobus]|uniref:Uncharacterized protein n=1 Tax=Psophocarpus tetragonolobus TaxID=3891 RepID=A0AAN9RTQ0_PSOTE
MSCNTLRLLRLAMSEHFPVSALLFVLSAVAVIIVGVPVDRYLSRSLTKNHKNIGGTGAFRFDTFDCQTFFLQWVDEQIMFGMLGKQWQCCVYLHCINPTSLFGDVSPSKHKDLIHLIVHPFLSVVVVRICMGDEQVMFGRLGKQWQAGIIGVLEAVSNRNYKSVEGSRVFVENLVGAFGFG